MAQLWAATPPAPPDSPVDIAGLQAWYDAADAATITDAGGGAVSQWDDKSGNARHVTQSTGTARPTTGSLTQNSLNVLSFDGGDHLVRTSAFWYGLGSCTVFLVAKITSGSNTTFVAEGRSGNANGIYQISNVVTSTNARFYYETNAASTQVDINTGAATTTARRLTIIDSGTSASITDESANTGSDGSYTRSTFTPDRFALGALVRTTVAAQITGWIAEVVIYTGVLSAPDIAVVETYLDTKWGL
jgi:hypothetical protein